MICFPFRLLLFCGLRFGNMHILYNLPSPTISTVSILFLVKHPVLLFVDVFPLHELTMLVTTP